MNEDKTNFTCKFCGNIQVEYVPACPTGYSAEHWACPVCNSTYAITDYLKGQYNMSVEEAFHRELVALCKKHGMCAVSTYEGKPSAHDPMFIVPLTKEWENYIENQVYKNDLDEDEV